MEQTNMTPLTQPETFLQVHRGDIYNILPGNGTPTGTEIWPNRPAVIVSNEAINMKSGFVTVVFLTTAAKRNMPYHVNIQSGKKAATALCEQVFSVDKSRIGFKIGTAADNEMAAIDTALQLSLSTVGRTHAQCVAVVQKWLLALEKHGISLTGRPDLSDMYQDRDEEMAKLTAERDLYRNMYRQQLSQVQALLSATT